MILKKGQVTEFIIVGIILVLAVGIFLYVKTQLVLPTDVPTDYLPVKTYVEGCTQQVTQNGVDLLGVQGGYIEIPDYINFDPRSYIQQQQGIGFKIPLWYYRGENRMPSLVDMEEDLAEYVEDNLQDCLAEYEPFEDQFEIEELSIPQALATISDNKINVQLQYEIMITDSVNDKNYGLEKFTATSTSRLGEVYELATEMMLTENEDAFLENITMDMIAVGDFPLEGMELACGKSWSEQQLKGQLANMIKYNLHYLTFDKTRNEESGIAYFDSEETGYVQKASSKSFRDIQVETIFDTTYGQLMYADPFGMDFEVYPSKGDRIEGIDMGIPIVGACLQIYHHFYKVEYPVVFQLTDYQDPNNPYTFTFATPVIIDNNQPSRTYDPTIIDTGFEAITSSQYCDTSVYELEVFAYDTVTQDELAGANISYECVGFRCDVGDTARPTFDGVPLARSVPVLIDDFPPCTNGFVVAQKEGYMEASAQHTVGDQMDHSIALAMTPIKEMDYRFIIKQGSKTRLIEGDEMVYMTIEDQKIPYSKTIYYPFEYEQFSKLELPAEDGSYIVDIKLIKRAGDLTGEEVIIGGYENLQWNITSEDVLNNELAVFTILSQDPEPTDMNGYVKVYQEEIMTKSKLNPPRLE